MRPRHQLKVILCVAGVMAGSTAMADEPPGAYKDVARESLLEGRAMLAAGDAAGALKAFLAAHSIMKVPTTGLDVARAQAALGQLIEARVTALEVTRMDVKPQEPEVFTKARDEASRFVEDLDGQIPMIVISVHGAAGAPSAMVDGVFVLPEGGELRRRVNPGKHTVEVMSRGFVTARRAVALKQGQTVLVEFALTRDEAEVTTRSTGDRPQLAGRNEAPVDGGPDRVVVGLGMMGSAALTGLGTGMLIGRAGAREESMASLGNAALLSYVGAGLVGVATLIYVGHSGSRASARLRVSAGRGGGSLIAAGEW